MGDPNKREIESVIMTTAEHGKMYNVASVVSFCN